MRISSNGINQSPSGAEQNIEHLTGYAHPAYAQSLAEFGTPVHLPRSSGWILERAIPNTSYCDAMGCYPVFACRDWSELHLDLEELDRGLVSLAIVADPFGEYDEAYLRKCFPDVVIPFKDHMVIDLARGGELKSFVDSHHQRNARHALARVHIELCPDPLLFADEWINLYSNLITRHRITGLTRFSPTSFVKQLAVPGLFMFRATFEDETVGMTLWYATSSVVYYHLGAYSDSGYKLRTSFAMFWQVIEYFSTQTFKWINLGASAGTSASDQTDGLGRFKRGWATGSRTAYFCGSILDHDRYTDTMKAFNVTPSTYFPAYRKGEFG